jgi:NAD(P)-dependent dehydrogenase (short-subunit alcohol dehydrogenase family)
VKIHTTKHEGKIAVITGGSSGIGLATARRLAFEGATVVVTGRRQPELDAAVQRIGHNASGVRGDIADLAHLDVLVGAIKGRHGRLGILFANAGTGELPPISVPAWLHGDGPRRRRERRNNHCSSNATITPRGPLTVELAATKQTAVSGVGRQADFTATVNRRQETELKSPCNSPQNWLDS